MPATEHPCTTGSAPRWRSSHACTRHSWSRFWLSICRALNGLRAATMRAYVVSRIAIAGGRPRAVAGADCGREASMTHFLPVWLKEKELRAQNNIKMCAHYLSRSPNIAKQPNAHNTSQDSTNEKLKTSMSPRPPWACVHALHKPHSKSRVLQMQPAHLTNRRHQEQAHNADLTQHQATLNNRHGIQTP